MVMDLAEVRPAIPGYGRIIRYQEGRYRGEVVEERVQGEVDGRVREIAKMLQGEKDIVRNISKMLSMRAYRDRLRV